MITNGDVFVVWKQRIVGAKDFADVRRVIDRCVEISVIADLRRDEHLRLEHRDECPRRQRIDNAVVSWCARQQLTESCAKLRQRFPRRLHQLIEIGAITPPGYIARLSCPQVRAQRLANVYDLIADRHADPPLGVTLSRENSEREVLNWKVGVG